jgi:hypothetical protein
MVLVNNTYMTYFKCASTKEVKNEKEVGAASDWVCAASIRKGFQLRSSRDVSYGVFV